MDEFRDLFDADSVDEWIAAGIIAAGVYAGLLVGIFVAGRILDRLARRSELEVLGLVRELVRRTHRLTPPILSLFFGSLALDLPDTATDVARTIAVLTLLIQVGLWGDAAIAYTTMRRQEREAEDRDAVSTLIALRFVGRLVIWSVLVVVALDNMGVEVTALVAGLGIGGIAVALAAQSILGDLFASFAMHLDRPFVVGDFIVVDGFLGTVEHIGVKTTRLKSLGGERLVFSNSDLLNSRIRNYKLMEERRIVFTLGILYETPADTLERIPGMLREIIESQDGVRFDRAHFQGYGDSSLDFEIVYFVLDPDFTVYMDVQQAINFALFRRFQDEGIGFAYPTRTLYVAGTDGSNGDAAATPDRS